mmetsp:Transcript_3528/g.9127  ORF Transcript_3528/g.9127 Transcript_3528/m.9127 type:complete len:398 (+) Transcript_3528:2121-3314(+)
MLDGAALDEPPPRLEVREDGLVRLLDVETLEVGNLVSEAAVVVDGAGHRLPLDNHAVLQADPVIVLAKGGGLVNDAGAAVVGHVGVGEHAVGHLCFFLDEVGEEGLVLGALEVRPLALLLDLVVGLLLEDLREARLAHDVARVRLLVAHVDIVEGGVHAKSEVRGERPRRRRPGDERGGGVGAHDRECDDALGVRHVLVVLSRLKVGEGGAAGRRVGHHLVAPVDEVLVKELLADPPDALHVVEVERLVIVLHVDPPRHPPHNALPLVGVAHHHAAALCIVCLDRHLEDVVARLDPQLLVNLVLNGKPVTVPAPLALHAVAVHVGVASHDVLDRPRQDVAIVRHARRKWGAVVKGVDRSVLIARHPEGFLEAVLLVPVLEHLLLRLGKLDVLRNILN